MATISELTVGVVVCSLFKAAKCMCQMLSSSHHHYWKVCQYFLPCVSQNQAFSSPMSLHKSHLQKWRVCFRFWHEMVLFTTVLLLELTSIRRWREQKAPMLEFINKLMTCLFVLWQISQQRGWRGGGTQATRGGNKASLMSLHFVRLPEEDGLKCFLESHCFCAGGNTSSDVALLRVFSYLIFVCWMTW